MRYTPGSGHCYSVCTLWSQFPCRLPQRCRSYAERSLHVKISMPTIPKLPGTPWHASVYIIFKIIKAQLCFLDVLSAHMSSKASRRGLNDRAKDTVLQNSAFNIRKKHK
jgi:hypothetical protein